MQMPRPLTSCRVTEQSGGSGFIESRRKKRRYNPGLRPRKEKSRLGRWGWGLFNQVACARPPNGQTITRISHPRLRLMVLPA